jgi:hypothetical protein
MTDPCATKNLGQESYDAGALETLDPGVTYYWRIDEINDPCVWKGDVWQFTINDGNAFDPDPADGQEAVLKESPLIWSPGCWAASNHVYFGTDYNEVEVADGASDPNVYYEDLGDVNTFDPCDFEYLTDYYWRIDEVNGPTKWKGQVWTFRSQTLIIDPNNTLWYELDETADYIAHDSSNFLNHGVIDMPEGGSPSWDPLDGRWGGSLEFDDDTAIWVPTAVLSRVTNGVGIIFWAKDPGKIALQANGGDSQLRVEFDNGVEWRAGNDTNDVLTWSGPVGGISDEWHCWAFVKDESEGTISIYFDASRVASDDVVDSTLAGVRNKPFKVGGETQIDNDFDGKMDDFIVYDRALLDTEIARQYEAGGPVGKLELAWGARPRYGQIDVPRDVNLAWYPGDFALQHDVYLGTDWDEVNDANTDSVGIYRGRKDPCEYDPCDYLELGTTYYWRIDEVNDPCVWKGNIWKFTVADFLYIDDFEDYSPGGGAGAIDGDNGWTQGFAAPPYTGAYLEIGLPYEGAAVRGQQSMQYYYDNTTEGGPYYSETGTKSLDPCDWTILDMKMLTLWFHGEYDEDYDHYNDANETEQLYVGIEDSDSDYAEVRYPMEDMNDIRLLDWTEWNIALSEFEADNPDVNLTNIETLYIGFGDRDSQQNGGWGVVYFDDIRLYSYRCFPEIRKPVYDLNNDCIVDFGEVEIMAEAWLVTDVNVGTVVEPDPCVLHYKFEETEGSTVYDSSTNDYHGTAMLQDRSPTDAFWEGGGVYGGCIRFEHQEKKYCVEMPNDVFEDNITNEITISVWVNWDNPETMPDEENQLFSVHGGTAADYNGILGIDTEWRAEDVNDEEVRFWDANGDVNDNIGAIYGVNELDWSRGWNHYAFVKDVSVIPGKLRIYHNGQLVAEADSNSPMKRPVDHAWIGMATDEPNDQHDNYEGSWHDEYTGLLDDFRIYPAALSAEMVAHIASEGTGIVTVQSIANLYNDEPRGERAINLRDFAVLADDWLVQKMWPPE